MIIFDLICADGEHRFEGWFGSSDDYADQQARGLLDCPVCGSGNIAKAVMAPNLGRKGNQQAASARPAEERTEMPVAAKPVSNDVAVPAEYREIIGKLAEAQEKMLASSEWVGDKFADRARDIHYGDAEEKPIHGTASQEEVADLAEEGIAALPLPLPVLPPESKN
ncbi:DUF1178 domain-containing protein [Sphingopyxis sp. BSNA05]|uniref:DUF1178 family protein n=1 Tax=Sphingomonadales TaxID=204457 RepID=UPI000C1E7E32|nr:MULTISPECIES: DUF1178 family protein [Sphingomonadaceae]ATW04277.1 hypothetical protein CHN51_12585 [Sphingorhabdus sp. YGSMI21]NRD88926.1 DUF1178 domain-containing protein [Sphingopyxis sp. BSNA05]